MNTISIHRAKVRFKPTNISDFEHVRFQISTPNKETPGFGRRMEPVVEMSRIGGWLKMCEEQHGASCHARGWLGEQQQPQFLRIIDVKKNCVCHAPPECR